MHQTAAAYSNINAARRRPSISTILVPIRCAYSSASRVKVDVVMKIPLVAR